MAETDYVFIKQNNLTARFSTLSTAEFTIIETGFGTGLNFFSAVQHFLTHAPAHAKLRFISIECYPLKLQDWIRANQHWPINHDLVTQLARLDDGLNQLYCCDNRIQLDLWIGDVNHMLPHIQATADAWFLDGFAPSKNSDMWSEILFTAIARLSKPSTSLSTFTSAGQVRRGLQSVGFHVAKVAGYGRKREMLRATFLDTPSE